ncbi:uncharacterized protein LOC143694004 [Agelaius phoeniceus]|uniref:uncharacterized protein LOC143694004 n=1 Tax=Agelaius phoeniceus TaxID=39638 RepID=UPI004054FA29
MTAQCHAKARKPCLDFTVVAAPARSASGLMAVFRPQQQTLKECLTWKVFNGQWKKMRKRRVWLLLGGSGPAKGPWLVQMRSCIGAKRRLLLGPALALGRASLAAELLQHARGLSPWIQHGALISSSHWSPWIRHGEPSSPAASWSRPLGKGSLVCDSEIHQCLFHSCISAWM